jgi:hypothetical protein
MESPSPSSPSMRSLCLERKYPRLISGGSELIYRRLINVLKAAKQEVPDALLKFGGTVKKKEHGAYGAFYKDVDMNKKATKITFD